MFEGTGKYFLIICLIFLIVFLTVKICLSKIFKDMKIASWKAYIPFYNRILLINALDLKKEIFYKTLIPFFNLYYYNIIIASLLSAYKLDPKESIMFILIPMYKFPELIFKNPKFMLHMYEETEEFINDQNILFKPETDINGLSSEIENQIPDNNENDTVFTNQNLQPDERKETIITTQEEKPKEKVAPIIVDSSKPKVCPNCGTKLAPTASICFLCGTKLE